MENRAVGLSYGIMSDKLSKQLDKQGYKYSKTEISRLEKELDAMHTLRFGSGLLTDSMVDKILQKLHKKIVSHVSSKNK